MKGSRNRRELSGWGLGFALETVAPESLVIKPVQVRFSNYLGQHWSETFRTSGGEAAKSAPRAAKPRDGGEHIKSAVVSVRL